MLCYVPIVSLLFCVREADDITSGCAMFSRVCCIRSRYLARQTSHGKLLWNREAYQGASRRDEQAQPKKEPTRGCLELDWHSCPTRQQLESTRDRQAKTVYRCDQQVIALQALPQTALSTGSTARILDATNNQISQLPDNINLLTSLQRLVLEANRLTSLPATICQLSMLKVRAA